MKHNPKVDQVWIFSNDYYPNTRMKITSVSENSVFAIDLYDNTENMISIHQAPTNWKLDTRYEISRTFNEDLAELLNTKD